jgi:hypothetical protein
MKGEKMSERAEVPEVERFEAPRMIGEHGWVDLMVPDPTGPYCWFSDYEKAQAERENYKHEAAQLEATPPSHVVEAICNQERQRIFDEYEKRFVDGDLPERIETAVRASERQRIQEALEGPEAADRVARQLCHGGSDEWDLLADEDRQPWLDQARELLAEGIESLTKEEEPCR